MDPAGIAARHPPVDYRAPAPLYVDDADDDDSDDDTDSRLTGDVSRPDDEIEPVEPARPVRSSGPGRLRRVPAGGEVPR